MIRSTTCRATLGIVIACIALVSGCTHTQLKRNSIQQARTVSDIYEQQVLDNLAKFAVNPFATPSFSIANQATNGVTDSGNFGIGAGAFTVNFWEKFSLGGSRDIDENFTLNPVTAPTRLKLMQCAYQRAMGIEPSSCQKCCELLIAWTGDKNACFDSCGITCGWVQHSDRWIDVPKDCCEKYGHHCGVYLWVDPCYRNEFSKLVMTIIDYAAGERAAAQKVDTKDIVLYLDAKNEQAKFGSHTQEIRVTVPRTAKQEDVVKRLQLEAMIESKSAKLEKLARANLEPEILEAFSGIDDVAPSIVQQNLIPDPNAKIEVMLSLKAQAESLLKQEIALHRAELETVRPIELQTIPQFDFGPPTQFNGFYGGGILQWQQQLDTVPRQRSRTR